MKPDYIFIDGNAREFALVRTSNEGSIRASYSDTFNPANVTSMYRVITPPRFAAEYIVVTHDAERKKELVDLFRSHPIIDIAQLAWALVFANLIPNRRLETLVKHYHIEDKLDVSEGSCTAIVRIFGIMSRRFKTALIGENAITELGGETFDGLRKLVNF